jgi:hypothetical protein
MIINRNGDKYLITISIMEAENIQRDLEKARQNGETSIVLKASVTEAKNISK